MKYLLLLAVICVFSGRLRAQEISEPQSSSRYHPSFRAGAFLFDESAALITAHFINDFDFGKYVKAGFGVGLEFEGYDNGSLACVPAFIDARWYPYESGTRPYIFGDIGYSVAPESPKWANGLCLGLGCGLSTPIYNATAFTFEVGYASRPHAITFTHSSDYASGLLVTFGVTF